MSKNEHTLKPSETLEKIVFAVVDFANAIEAATISLRQNLKELGPPEWNPEKVKWREAQGTHGPYQRYPGGDEKAEVTLDYKNMLADLKNHDGRLTREGYFYWLFNDAATVGRKPKKKN